MARSAYSSKSGAPGGEVDLDKPLRFIADRDRWRAILSAPDLPTRPYVKVVAVTVVAAALPQIQPLLLRNIIDQLARRHTDIALDVAIFFLLGLAAVVTNYWSSIAVARLSNHYMAGIRLRLFDALQRMPVSFFTHAAHGSMVSRMTGDAYQSRELFGTQVPSVLADATTVAVISVALLLTDVRLFALLLVLVAAISPLSRRRVKAAVANAAVELETNAHLVGRLSDRLRPDANLHAKAFHRYDTETASIATLADEISEANIEFIRQLNLVSAAFSVITLVGFAVAFWLGSLLVGSGTMSVGTLVLIVVYLSALQAPLARLWGVTRFQVGYRLAAMDRLIEGISLRPAVKAPEANLSLATAAEPEASTPPQAGDSFDGFVVSFEHVGVDYEPPSHVVPASFRERLASVDGDTGGRALEDVSFTVEKGQLVAIVGATGAGKSTLGLVAAGLLPPTAGRIAWYGLENAPRIAYVAQDTWLFHDSIRENLLYAAPEANEVELVNACVAARVHKTIRQFPLGYGTVVGQHGYRLSGGERQRLALARALLTHPDLVVLDEPTAHLDPETEREIQNELEGLFRSRTCIVITHRISTVERADRIIVLRDGRVVEQGSHAALAEAGGAYATLRWTTT